MSALKERAKFTTASSRGGTEDAPRDRFHHLNDLNNMKRESPTLFPTLTYVVYVRRAVRNFIVTLFCDWTMPFTQPFNCFALFTIIPVSIIAFPILELSLQLMFLLGFGKVLSGISERWGGGLSPVNWWNPRIFGDEVIEIVRDGITGLNSPPRSGAGTSESRNFNIDVAETCLFMSAIVYERDDDMVREAHSKLAHRYERTEANSKVFEEIDQNLRESEKRIHEQAQKWGLNFTSLSELNSLGGPFAGMFWSYDNNFIVVVFKGTTPTNFEDFLVDAMIQRVNARTFVYGDVHEGFYTSLFPEGDDAVTRAHNASPYTTIVKAIREKANEIRASNAQKNPSPVNIWVTGHSLGAALATLFYARILKSPGDLNSDCVIRDGYLFGTPAIGDADFADRYAEIANTPFDRDNTLWRVIDDTDIITKLPIGFDNPKLRPFISKYSILNYSHVGEGIRFFHDGRRPVSSVSFEDIDKRVIVESSSPKKSRFRYPFGLFGKSESVEPIRNFANGEPWVSKKDVFKNSPFQHPEGSPLIWLERMLPTFFRNHLPTRYFEVMQRARIYFDDDDDDDERRHE